ncbi:MAG: PaaI family thioesterase [Lachnospiraceae bacterium]|nr:PaaI family thioesterase [Lachnospiraceae bacterium]
MSLNLANAQTINLKREQAIMEKTIETAIAVTKSKGKSGIIEMMGPKFFGCSYENKELSTVFHVEKWELNPQGSMHGGLVSTAFDTTFGILSHYHADDCFITTVDLSTRYLKPIPLGSDLIVKVKACSVGRTLVSLTGEAYLAGKDIIVATASSTFMILRDKKTQLTPLKEK